MLCHLDISLSRAFRVVMVPFTESMLKSLSRSVCRSMEYLKEGHVAVHTDNGNCNLSFCSENEVLLQSFDLS